ncbi:hypothetical protein [Peribacillus sp. R9-11]|uniref:hypothetical protein n=1 Tax=Peribacillus sp. R9-11 TaxID=3073271 RepID=UPI0028695427|nr:hypothetical protein [Peribacillus sp. R9-11]WMX57472.1 hypothetical protein RE409_09750 [Peribacillus sp. R9-11]
MNVLIFSWGTTITHGDLDTWIGFFATYYGAIIGGIIAGALTLIGVKMTINSTMEGVKRTINQQKNLQKHEIMIQTKKERLTKFYGPMSMLRSQFDFRHNAHNFSDLDFDEQKLFLQELSDNLLYTDSEIYIKAIEMRWAFKDGDYSYLNEAYKEITEIITDELHSIRKLLRLPTIEI